ncbi:unnamed protein product [Musa hybrid cultivar]
MCSKVVYKSLDRCGMYRRECNRKARREMGRRPCCSKEGLNRGAWSAREDQILTDYITTHGEGKWRDLPESAGLKRCGKSCRLRWLNYLRPDIKRGNITEDEENLIVRLHALLGNRWSLIAGRLPGRTDNEIKNYWNTYLSKKTSPQLCIRGSSRRKENKKGESSVEEVTARDGQPSQVIRTTAVRCNKVYLPSLREEVLPTDNYHSYELTHHNESTSSLVLRDAGPVDFLADFDMDELMSSFEDDGLLQRCIDEAHDDGNFNSLWFCDAMQQDAREGTGCPESHAAFELESLASPMDSAEGEQKN